MGNAGPEEVEPQPSETVKVPRRYTPAVVVRAK